MTTAVKLGPYDRFYATFRPKRTDDLRPGSEKYIGQRILWEAAWIMGEDDTSKFVGQWACLSIEPYTPPFVWVPEEDLQDVELVERVTF